MKLRTLFISVFIVLISSFLSDGLLKAQFNERYPKHPIDLTKAEIVLNVEPQNFLLQGKVKYFAKVKSTIEDSFILHAQDLEIDAVSLNGERVEFSVSTDSLSIQIEQPLERDELIEIEISWQSLSVFGLHRDFKYNFWSSLNSNSLHYWIPSFNYIGEELSVRTEFQIPADYEVVSNGLKVSDEVISTEKKKVVWQTQKEIPITGISFVLGKFKTEQANSGITNIQVFAENSLINDEQLTALLRNAVITLKATESVLRFEYPYESLNVVLLPDMMWMQKQWSSGTVYLFSNLGDINNQLERGIYSQWFGERFRPFYLENDSDFYELVKAAIHAKLGKESSQLLSDSEFRTPSLTQWNKWQQILKSKSVDSYFKSTVEASLPELARLSPGIVEGEDFAKTWYKITGLPWFELPNFELPIVSETEVVLYPHKISVNYDEISSEIDITFRSIDAAADSITAVIFKAVSPSDTASTELLFSGLIDSAQVKIPLTTSFIIFEDENGESNQFKVENIPAPFLVNQIRSSNVDWKISAAKSLADYSDDKDLQLAINDILRSESNVEVRAALLETYGVFANGGLGTEQIFIDGINNSSESIQLASLKTLKNYPNNDFVQSSVRSKILSTENEEVFERAINTYFAITNLEQQQGLVTPLLRAESTGTKSLKILEQSVTVDTSGTTLRALSSFLNASFPFSTREKALSLLLKHQANPSYWSDRITELMFDVDPRIRLKSVTALKLLEGEELQSKLEMFRLNENDPRIQSKLSEF